MIFAPGTPGPQKATPRFLSTHGDLQGPLGGPMLRLARGGSRFALDVTLPPMRYELGLIWVSCLTRGMTEVFHMPFPQPGATILPTTAVVVDGAGQVGTSLAVKNFASGYTMKQGRFLNVADAGEYRLYQLAADVTADADGYATLLLTTPLRQVPANEAPVEVVSPCVDGFVQGRELAWDVDLAATVGLSFSVMDRA